MRPVEHKKGIYIITNSCDSGSYVGSVATSFRYRIGKHRNLLRKNKHPNIYLQAGWNLYGETKFTFTLLEECLPEKCIEREAYYIENLKPKYNFCKKGWSRLGLKDRPETIEKKRKIALKRVENWKKIGKSLAANSKKMRVFDKSLNTEITFVSMAACAEYLQIPRINLWRIMIGYTKKYKNLDHLEIMYA